MKRYISSYIVLQVFAVMFLSSCANHPSVPSDASASSLLPPIFPDYCDVTVPCNIAPLNFMLPADEYEACVARLTTPNGQQQTYGKGVKVQIPEEEWHTMLAVSKGKSMKVEVWGKRKEERGERRANGCRSGRLRFMWPKSLSTNICHIALSSHLISYMTIWR